MDTPPRGIRSFVDIRKREFEPALLFFFFWFLVIVVFQALRPLKKGLFVEHLGADVELYAKLANIGGGNPGGRRFHRALQPVWQPPADSDPLCRVHGRAPGLCRRARWRRRPCAVAQLVVLSVR